MKTVYFIRHAKSSWSDAGLSDHDRPLNPRGLRDAPVMAAYLRQNAHFRPDVLLTSSARRAQETARFFQNEFGLGAEQYLIYPQLYHATPVVMLETLHELLPDVSTVALFAHNPGMTWLANMFSQQMIDNIPTTGTFRVDFDVDDWTAVSTDGANATFVQLWTPKTLM